MTLPALPALVSLVSVVAVPADDPRVLQLGTAVARHAAAMRWPLAELRVHFTGTSLRMDATASGEALSDRFAIIVDGTRREAILPRGRHTVVLVEGLADAAHELRLIKKTEPAMAHTRVHAFLVDDDAELLATPARDDLQLEVIGDSIATGFGVLGTGPECGASVDVSDATFAFPALVADELGAEVRVVAWSGRGVLRDYTGRLHDASVPSVPQLWRTAVAGSVPDVVVIALGGNDFYGTVPEREPWLREMRALLDEVARRAPHAHVVLVAPAPLSAAPDEPALVARTWLEALADETAARARPVVVTWPPRDLTQGVGCVFHPNAATQRKLAEPITTAIRMRLAPQATRGHPAQNR